MSLDEDTPATRDGGAQEHTIDKLQNCVGSCRVLQERGMMMMMMMGEKDDERREVKVRTPF